jgi:hypothetical protein
LRHGANWHDGGAAPVDEVLYHGPIIHAALHVFLIDHLGNVSDIRDIH